MDAARILSGLNEAQKAAVTSPASVLQVLAPPGSGKTKTLTARVAYLIAQHGLNPRNIIVCTFTNKAAAEMQERITGFFGESVAKKLILGTFHSICRRFLAEHGSLIDLDKKFGIADTSDQKSIIKRIVGTLNLGADSNLPKTVQSRISSCKSKGQTIEQYLASSKGQDKYEFVQIWGEYEEHLRSSNLLDFDDLLLRCCDLLRAHPECVGGIDAVLVDEFQDTNNIQYDLMMLFSQRRQVICIVGDPDQSIYGWRNAEIANLKKMRDKFPETHVEILSDNYRTSGAVLQAAQEVIEQDEQRTKKKLMPTHSIGVPAVLRRLPSTDAEANWLVFEIKRTQALTAGLLTCNDYAILLRSAALSRQIESALGKEGIPYRMVGGHKFFDRMEVKLVLDYLRVISQTSHTEALLRIINVPRRGIGEASLDVLIAAATANKVPLWEVVKKVAQRGIKLDTKLSEQAIKGLALFSNLIITAQKRLRNPPEDKDTLLDFLKYVLEKVGIPKYLKEKEKDNDSVDYDTRIANIQELVQQASEFSVALQNGAYDEEPLLQDLGDTVEVLFQDDLSVEEGDTSQSSTEDILSKFLANVALATDNQKTQEDGPPKPMVTISTIHAAKGLEWPVVFIPAAYNGSIPHSRAENNDEERRLLYVAMTRAQSLLYLSCPVKDQSRNDVTLSPFLSKQGMDAYFAKSGTTLGYDVVKEISVILRRPCPDAAILGEALISYDWPKDNKWPERGFVDEEEEHTQWGTLGADIDYRNGERGFKRPKIGMEDESYGRGGGFDCRTPVPGYAFSTTMTNVGGFSSAKTTLPPNAGFMSARDVKIEEPPPKIPKQSRQSSFETQGPAAKGTKNVAAAVAGTKKKSKPLPDDQGSLLSFFSRPLSRSVSQDDTPDEPTASLPGSVAAASAMPVSIPLLRTSSSLASKPHAASRSAAAPAYTRPVSTPQPSFRARAHDENVPPRSAATGDSDAKTTAETQTRPATTFHTTSVAAVVSSERIRKTLGVRRSMQGWAARVNR